MPATDREPRSITPWLVILLSAMVVAVGVQFWYAEAARDDRERAAVARDIADRKYADCLTGFATDLVNTIETRTNASARLERAERRLERADDRKAAALDQVIVTVLLARRVPPEATEAEFDAALQARVNAQARYDEVRARVEVVRDRLEDVRADNPYVYPEVVCDR